MMQESTAYRLSDAGVRRILLRHGAWTPESLGYTLVLGLGIGILGQAPLWPLIVVYIIFTVLHLKAFRNFPRLKDTWRGFEVILETDRVVVRRRDSIEDTVSRPEVTRILEMPGHGLWIHTVDARKRISIPSQVTGYEELKSSLAGWATIELKRSAPLWIHFGLPAAAAIYISALLVRSPYVFFPALAFAGYYLVRFARISIKGWLRKEDHRPGVLKDPFWIPAMPFMMLALLLLKLVWIIMPSNF